MKHIIIHKTQRSQTAQETQSFEHYMTATLAMKDNLKQHTKKKKFTFRVYLIMMSMIERIPLFFDFGRLKTASREKVHLSREICKWVS